MSVSFFMAYRSSWKFWQALTPATIRRLLKPRHPFSGIAQPSHLWHSRILPSRPVACRFPWPRHSPSVPATRPLRVDHRASSRSGHVPYPKAPVRARRGSYAGAGQGRDVVQRGIPAIGQMFAWPPTVGGFQRRACRLQSAHVRADIIDRDTGHCAALRVRGELDIVGGPETAIGNLHDPCLCVRG